MLQELVTSPGEHDPGSLHERYREELSAVVDSVGVDAVAAETDVDPSRLEALGTDGDADLSLSEAAAVLATDRDPDGEAIRQEALDHLLLGMTTAVLDVDSIAANLDLDLSPTEVQQRVEGRTPMTLREFVHVYALIEDRKR